MWQHVGQGLQEVVKPRGSLAVYLRPALANIHGVYCHVVCTHTVSTSNRVEIDAQVVSNLCPSSDTIVNEDRGDVLVFDISVVAMIVYVLAICLLHKLVCRR